MTQVIDNTNNNILLFYIPVPDERSAKSIIQILLENKLIGCANIIKDVSSFYFWQGALQNTTEFLIIAKTLPELKTRAQNKVIELHPYDCPAIISFEVQANKNFADFISSILLQTFKPI